MSSTAVILVGIGVLLTVYFVGRWVERWWRENRIVRKPEASIIHPFNPGTALIIWKRDIPSIGLCYGSDMMTDRLVILGDGRAFFTESEYASLVAPLQDQARPDPAPGHPRWITSETPVPGQTGITPTSNLLTVFDITSCWIDPNPAFANLRIMPFDGNFQVLWSFALQAGHKPTTGRWTATKVQLADGKLLNNALFELGEAIAHGCQPAWA